MSTPQPQKTEQKNDGLLCYDFFGNKSYLTLPILIRKVSHPYYVLFMLTLMTLYFLFDLNHHREEMSALSALTLWLFFVTVLSGAYTIILTGAIQVGKSFPKFFIIPPLFGLLSMSGATLTEAYFETLFTPKDNVFELYREYILTNLSIGLIFLICFDLLLYARIRDGKKTSSSNARKAKMQFTIANKSFDSNELYSLSSQDHYVEIRTNDSTVLLRGRLIDIVSQLGGVDGIVPHRSHWVSRGAVDRLGGTGAAKTLKLTDGTEVPIARSRVADVRKWLDNS